MTLSQMTPPGIPMATEWRERRVLEGEAEVARADCSRHEGEICAGLLAVEQGLRDLQAATQRLGAAQSRLTGREPRSIVDGHLQPIRSDVSAALLRIEAAVWSAV